MNRLGHEEWGRLNRFCLELHSDNIPEQFFHRCVEELPRVLGIHFAAWQWMDENFQFVDHTVTKEFEQGVAEYEVAMMQTMDTHPVVRHVHTELDGDCSEMTLAMTDLASIRQIRNRGIHTEAYRHLGIQDQVYTELQFSHQTRAGLTFNFEDMCRPEQKLMIDLVKPHLILAYKKLLQVYPELGPGYLKKAAASEPMLSPRLRQTKDALLEGLPRKLIADRMGISIHTLNDYVKELYLHLGVHSHAELISRVRD